MRKRIRSTLIILIILCILYIHALFQADLKWAKGNGYLTLNEADGWTHFELVSCENNSWFKIYAMPGNVYALLEPFQDQLVISYLICGNDRALLFDTGMGIANIKDCVTQLTDKPITVLNSHVHFDHTGGNYLFDEVICYNIDSAVRILTDGVSHDELSIYVPLESLADTPETFSYEDYYRVGKAPTATVEDGQIIDLGGRQLEVMYTPGHEETGIMLIDEKNSIIFTGDTWYPGPLLLVSEDSSMPDYCESLKKQHQLYEIKIFSGFMAHITQYFRVQIHSLSP